ncbi:hypothetical protein BST81_10855 [Leptolyngbya sp. 'hensonii']|nr:hypothetical protein BST81_10855 [Leptolyngbya sp. 'hensonii']
MVTDSNIKYRINIHYQEQRRRYYAEDLGQGILLKLVEIPAGTFRMGSPDDELDRQSDEGPQHDVTLNRFCLGMYPVTQAQWRSVAALPLEQRELDPDPSHFKGDVGEASQNENRPVEQVSWEDAMEFCARLCKKTGREYGLPTEAEWEYACRAGTTSPFHFGETITTDLVNYDGRYVYGRGPKGIYRQETTPVGSFPANAFGLYDLHGNVWEWCADHYHGDYTEKPDALKLDGNTPWETLEIGSERVFRGGSWNPYPWHCRSAIRLHHAPDDRDDVIGFRVVSRFPRAVR